MMHSSQTANLFALANLEGEVFTLKALISSDAAINLAAVRDRCAIVTNKVHTLYQNHGISGALACEILESIANAALTVSPSYWQKHFPDDLSYLFDEESIAHLHDEAHQENEPESEIESGWALNGRTYYGGLIAPGEQLEEEQYQCMCPRCGKTALRTCYQRVEGGALNSYQRTECTRCNLSEDTGDYY